MKSIEKEATVIVSRVKIVSGDKEDEISREKTIKIKPFITDPAQVGCEKRALIRTGDFENYGVKVWASFPCYVEDVPRTSKAVRKFVERELDKELSEVAAMRGE
jgi:hypothetical protein